MFSLKNTFLYKVVNTESGNSLFEILVAVTLFSVYGLMVTQGNVISLKMFQSTEVSRIASSLAISQMESVSSHNVSELDSSYNTTEEEVIWPGSNITFTRVTTVTLNADKSKTIDVIVSSNNAVFSKSIELSTSVAQWE
jgi:Tfp pilus assembly protein PilV